MKDLHRLSVSCSQFPVLGEDICFHLNSCKGEGNLTPQSWSRKHLMDGAKKTEFLERTRLTPVCLLALLAFNRVLTMSALLSLLATSGCNSIDTQDERGDSEARAIDGCGWWESGQCWIWNPRLISTDQLSVILCLPRLMLLTTRARFQPWFFQIAHL